MNEPTDSQIIDYYMKANSASPSRSCVDTVRHFLAKQKNETGDMLSFEEWSNSCENIPTREQVWNIARQGMIALPPESEWPEWATKIVITFQGDPGGCGEWWKVIPRTKPQPIKMTIEEVLERLEKLEGKKVEIIE